MQFPPSAFHFQEPGYLSWCSDMLGARGPGFDSRQRQEVSLYSTASRQGLTKPIIQWVPVYNTRELLASNLDRKHRLF
jgi:hypothetical protein